jgi:hypothetical protein
MQAAECQPKRGADGKRRLQIALSTHPVSGTSPLTVAIRWDEKAGLRRDAVRFQVIDVLEAQKITERILLASPARQMRWTKASGRIRDRGWSGQSYPIR